MKGHLRERSPGKWAIVIDLGPRENGRRRQKWISFRGSKRAAQIELHRLIAKRETLPDAGNRQTLGEYLNKWVEEQRIGAKSLERYKQIVRTNLIPALGADRAGEANGGPDQRALHQSPREWSAGRPQGRTISSYGPIPAFHIEEGAEGRCAPNVVGAKSDGRCGLAARREADHADPRSRSSGTLNRRCAAVRAYSFQYCSH